jgi:peptidoglycan/LPS O-acetylase OafA/YrhL
MSERAVAILGERHRPGSSGRRNSVDPINLLRAVAIYFMVFFTHGLIADSGLSLSKAGVWFLFQGAAWAGVWTLFVISGYLMGKGFYSKKYALGRDGLRTFYLGRLIRIAPPYLFLCLIVGLFVHPEYFASSPLALLRVLTFTYNGNPGVVGIGATWYVSTIAQLYLLTPLVFFLVRGLSKNKAVAAIVVVAILGMAVRFVLYKLGASWCEAIYSPSVTNLDLFVCGMLLGGITFDRREDSISRRWTGVYKVASTAVLFGLILGTCYLYFWANQGKAHFLFVYQLVLPTAYLFAVAFYLFAFDYRHTASNERLSLSAARRNPLRAIDGLSAVSYDFYLWHSSVLVTVFPMVGGIFSSEPHVAHVVKLAIAGVVALGVAMVMHFLMEGPIFVWRSSLAARSSQPRR